MPPRHPQRAAIYRQPTAEEAELFLRRSQLAALRSTLARRETRLAALRSQLNSFEGRYIRQVGVLYIQLDDWEDRIAQLTAPTDPNPTPEPEPEPTTDPEPTPPLLDLKSLFREVAKRIHPDFARDPHDELRRTHLMAQANDAFRRDDAAILHRMLHGYDPSTGFGDTSTTAAQLALVLAQLTQSATDLETIDAELAALTQSEMAQLQQRTVRAALHGRDLLAELAARVKGSIGIAMRRYELDLARIRRHQPAFDPSPLLTAEITEPLPLHHRPRTATRATIESDKC